MSADDTPHEILTSALGLLTATHADSRMAGPLTRDYLAAVGNDTKKVIRLATSMTALARRMHASGKPVKTIAETLGVSAATVYRLVAE